MITVSATTRSILASGSFTYWISVQAWLGDQLLATDVPVTAGQEETDRSLKVPERATLTVAKRAAGIDWTPTGPSSPLAANGQTLKISLGIGRGADGVEWFQRGEYLIQSTAEDDDGLTLSVTVVGLLGLVDEAKFAGPFQPTGTLAQTIRSVIEPAVTVDLTNAPADRALPTLNFDTDRLAALYTLLDAWPAVPRMSELGYLEVVAPSTPAAGDEVLSFTTLDGGTAITAVGQSTRDGAFNAVVATGYATDGTEVRGIVYVSSGPWAYPGGQSNPLVVPFGYSSPAIGNQAIATAVARTVLQRKMREAVLQAYTITAVLDPTLQIGDVVTITNDYVTDLLCTVEAITLPLFATAPMRVKVVTVS